MSSFSHLNVIQIGITVKLYNILFGSGIYFLLQLEEKKR